MSDNITKFMQSLDLDYGKAIESTEKFATKIDEFNKQLREMSSIAQQTAKEINAAFASQLGSNTNVKALSEQYGNAYRIIQDGAKTMSSSTKESLNYINKNIQDFGVVIRKTFEDAEKQVYKYIDTYKDLKNGINIADTYVKNEAGGFDFSGRTIDNKSIEMTYKAIEKAHAEALKMNAAFDETLVKNQQLTKNSAWKQYFQNISQTSDELKELNRQYLNLEKAGDSIHAEALKMNAEYDKMAANIKQSTFEQIKAQAASVQQRVSTKKLSEDYSIQAKLIREQASILQEKLQITGKLSMEEMKQTQNLQEQLNILKQQSSASIADDIAMGKGIASDEWNRRTSWFLSGTLFYGMINGAKQAISTIKDVEMGMIEIARIMDDSSFSFQGYRDQLLQLGIDYGQTFENVQDIALRWAQAGYNVKDSLELTRTALLALNTAELDAANATDSMIGIMAQWGLKASELELVIDKINKTADDYTVSSQDLVDGLLRSSSAAKNMNMTLEDTISLLTVMREASGRTGQEVGNALNSILSYIQRPKSIDVLESMGIAVFTDKTKQNFRNAMDLFRDIATNWKNTSDAIKDGFIQSADDAGLFNEELAEALGLQEEWNDLQRRDVAQASAGVYRRNYFIGMIERMTNTQSVLNNMMDAGGYSMRENANTMDSLEKKYASLKASVEQLAIALGDAGLLDMLKSGVDIATNLTKSIQNLDDNGKALLLTALELITAFTAIKSIGNLTGISGGIKGVLDVAGIALPGWTKLIPLVLGVVSALGLYAYNTSKANDVTREFKERQEKIIESSKNQKDAIENTKNEMYAQTEMASRLANKIEELSKKESLNASEKAQMKSITKQLNDIMPNLNLVIDEQTGKINGNTDAIRDNIKAMKDQAIQQAYQAKMQATASEYVEQEMFVGDLKTRIDEKKLEYERLKREIVESEKLAYENGTITGFTIQENAFKLNELETDLKDLNKQWEKSTNLLSNLNDELDKLYDKEESLTDDKIKDNIKPLLDYDKALNDSKSSINEVSKELAELNQLIYDSKKGQSLSSQTILDLMEKYNLSADSIKVVSDGYKIEVSVLEELRKQKLKNTLDNIQSVQKDISNEKIRLESVLSSYGLEIEQLKNLAEARKALARIDKNKPHNVQEGFEYDINNYENVINTLSKYEYSVKRLEELKKQSDLLISIINNPLNGVKTSNSADKYENKALAEEYKKLDYQRFMNEIELIDEITRLHEIKAGKIKGITIKTADELMDINKRIYSAEKSLQDEKSKLSKESFQKEMDNIRHLTNLGIYSTQQQIEAYKKLYSAKVESLVEEQSRVENLFNLYKKLLSEQQSKIKEAYDERIKMIDEEANAEKAKKEERIKGLREELDLIDRKDSQHSYEQTISDIRKEIEYWQVRTSEEARKKVIELEKQLDEEKYKRELELKKQSINDKIEEVEDEIDEIDRLANEEKKRWEKSYKLTEKAFDTHSTNIIAMASTMSKEAYEQWELNYLIPLQNALSSGNLSDFEKFSSSIGNPSDSIETVNSKIYSAASHILELKKQWHNGDISAADRAIQYYEKLRSLGNIGQSVASQLSVSNYETAKDIIANLPRYHTGRLNGIEELAVIRKDEIVFPPELSRGLRTLFPIIADMGKGGTSYDNRKEIKIEKLVNIENNRMEDDVDEQSFAREVRRVLNIL